MPFPGVCRVVLTAPVLYASLIPTLGAPLEVGSRGMGVMASPASSPVAAGRYGVQLQPVGTLPPSQYGTRGQQRWWHQSRCETREPHPTGGTGMMVSALRKTPNLKDVLCVSMRTHPPRRDSVLCRGHAHPPPSAAAGTIQPGLIPGLQQPTGTIAGLGYGCGQGQGQCFGRAMPQITVCCTPAQVLA